MRILPLVSGWRGAIANLKYMANYPEAPVPKSIAITCVKTLSYLKSAIVIQTLTNKL